MQLIVRASSYVVYACSVVFITMTTLVDIKVLPSMADSRALAETELVNRTRKQDRLSSPSLQVHHWNALSQERKIDGLRKSINDLELAEGCEPLTSPLTHSPLARIAARCLS
jgi:hypothetical protein